MESQQNQEIDPNQILKQEKVAKIPVQLKEVGNAPVLKQNKFILPGNWKFGEVIKFVKKKLALKQTDEVYCYVNSSFAPGIQEELGDLYQCFNIQTELIVNYHIQEAWG